MKKQYLSLLLNVVAVSFIMVNLIDKFELSFCFKIIIPLAIIIGNLGGRLSALEIKMDRLEKGISEAEDGSPRRGQGDGSVDPSV